MDEKWTRGQFVTKKIVHPAVEVDGSKWEDTSTGNWTTGHFVTRKHTRPAFEVKLKAPVLKIRVSYIPGVSLIELQQTTLSLVSEIINLAPELVLQYDRVQSTITNSDDGQPEALIVLVPQAQGIDPSNRMQLLLEEIRSINQHSNIADLEPVNE
jgi:hypothetical protein